jgi:hypothetical protein
MDAGCFAKVSGHADIRHQAVIFLDEIVPMSSPMNAMADVASHDLRRRIGGENLTFCS